MSFYANSGGPAAGKQSRKAKRTEKKQQQQSEQQALAGPSINYQEIERNQLNQKLDDLGLAIHEIRADGHCLFSALAHQLSVRCGIAPLSSSIEHHIQLRREAANYIRNHRDQFEPFVVATSSSSSSSPFDDYCNNIEKTSTWGGQLEVQALASHYQCQIKIVQADGPILTINEECEEVEDHPTLWISFHKREYGLGEHYNSLIPKSDSNFM